MGENEIDDTGATAPALWFPFTRAEFEIALGLVGLVLAGLSLAGVDRETTALGTLTFSLAAYVAGLLVHARRAGATFRFVEDGGLGGRGYLAAARRAKRSLLLQHVDDDAPNAELLGLYRRLLDANVLLRRLIFLRHDAKPEGLAWIRDFGTHANLEQRLVLPEQAELMRWSFAVIDEREVVVSMPGISALDTATYSGSVLLRHVMVLRDRAVAAAFVRMHAHVWQQALPIADVSQLPDPDALRLPGATRSDVAMATPRAEGACSSRPRAPGKP